MTPLHVAIATARAAKRWPGPQSAPVVAIAPAPVPVADLAPPPPEPPRRPPRLLTVRLVQEVVADHYGMTVDRLLAHCTSHTYTRPRQIAMHLSKKIARRSYPEIGRMFDGRDSSTVLHGCRSVQSRICLDDRVAAEVAAIEAKIAAATGAES